MEKKKRLSKAEYLWKADNVCLAEVNCERNIGLPPFADPLQATDADMPAAAEYGDQLLPCLRIKLDGLHKLGIPEAGLEEELIKGAIQYFEQTVENFVKANEAAHKGDSEGFRKFWAKGRSADHVSGALFIEFGLVLCAAD